MLKKTRSYRWLVFKTPCIDNKEMLSYLKVISSSRIPNETFTRLLKTAEHRNKANEVEESDLFFHMIQIQFGN